MRVVSGKIPDLLQFLPSNTFKQEQAYIDSVPNSKSFLKKNLPIWNKLADFMGYGIIEIPEKSFLIYSKRILGQEELENFKLNGNTRLSDIEKELFFLNWRPTIDYEQANKCEQKLLEEASYRRSEFIHFSGESATVRYFGSQKGGEGVSGIGKTKIEAICNACINFYEENFDEGE